MTSHNPNDELDPTLQSALDQHARSVGRPIGNIDDVWSRVERRRGRRRQVAIFGSMAIVAAGVVGIAFASGSQTGDGDDLAAATPASEQFASTTIVGPATGNVWACTGSLGGDGNADYYQDCVLTTSPISPPNCATLDTMPPVTAPPTTAPMTVPTTISVATTYVMTDASCVAPAPCDAYAAPTTMAPTPTIPVTTVPQLCPLIEIYPPMTTYVVMDTAPPPTSVSGYDRPECFDPVATLRVAREAWLAETGDGSEPTEADLVVAGYIRAEFDQIDLISGVVVGTTGGICDGFVIGL